MVLAQPEGGGLGEPVLCPPLGDGAWLLQEPLGVSHLLGPAADLAEGPASLRSAGPLCLVPDWPAEGLPPPAWD